MSSCWRRLALFTAAWFLFPILGIAQSAPVRLAGAFRVVVRDASQHPKANVRVTLGKPNAYTLRAVMRGNTSQDGILSFAKIPPGEYTLQLIDSIGETNLVPVEIVAKGGMPELSYTWPYIHWLPMNFVSGILMNGSAPMNRRNIVVRTFPGEAVVASAETDLRGAFDVPVMTPGRYVLDVSQTDQNGASQYTGRIYAIVSLQGERETEPLFAEQSPAGLVYDRFCTLQPADVKDGCLQTTSAEGAPLPGAVLHIRPETGFSPEQVYTSDAEGMVRLPMLPPAAYNVQVYARGKTPLRLRVQMDATGACTNPLRLSFNAIGSGCAPATPGKAN